MDRPSRNFTTPILLAALAIALAAILVLWGVRGVSLISAFLTGIVAFLASSVALSVVVAAVVGLTASRKL
jgi:hypothetical protein